MDAFTVTFWGVRGSVPVPGPSTVKYGGNTPCVEVRCGKTLIIIDAGTGAVPLGRSLIKQAGPIEAYIFFSHFHWDHIQGFPFFAPFFNPANTFHFYGSHGTPDSLKKALAGQMENPNFPIALDFLPSTKTFNDTRENEKVSINGGEIIVETVKLYHPTFCIGFRISYAGKVFVYASDNEHYDDGIHKPLKDTCANADLVIFDAAYTPEEYRGDVGPARKTWGHSTWEVGTAFAKELHIKKLALFHHDYTHNDAMMDEIADKAIKAFPNTVIAREGMTIVL